jgi:hypothetical protein
MCYNKEKEKINMNKKQIAIKQIKDQMKTLQYDKKFLEKVLFWRVNDLRFYDHFNYLDERQKTINYLDMTWEQYDRVVRVLKELKRDLKGSKLVR